MQPELKKIEALFLRRKGMTYSEISKKLSVPKSSISYWLRYAHLDPALIETLARKRKEQLSKARAARGRD